MQFELAARLRDQIVTVHQAGERQRIASADSDDADVFGFHFEKEMLAVNLFHMRGGSIVDRRDFFWEDLPDFESDVFDSPVEQDLDTEDIASDPRLEPEPIGTPRQKSSPTPNHPTSTPSWPHPSKSTCPEASRSATAALIPNWKLKTFHSQLETTPRRQRSLHHGMPSGTWAVSQELLLFPPVPSSPRFLKQLYLDQSYVPKTILVPVDFPDRAAPRGRLLRERSGHKIEILAPQRGEKRSLVDLVCQNAKQSYDQRFRVLQPSRTQHAGTPCKTPSHSPSHPTRIECFDISHIQGAETVASMVVWENGAMKKADYRKFQVKTVSGVDDFASMREIILRRYRRFGPNAEGAKPSKDDSKPLPSLILIDGGLGQLHAAADALQELGLTSQPLASIAKREEVIYVHGQEEDPVVLDRRSPVLHVIQKIRDESHRFAINYHRKRRQMRDRTSEIDEIPGVGVTTRRRLIEHFGSVRALKEATAKSPDALEAVVTKLNKATAAKIVRFFSEAGATGREENSELIILQ